MRYWRESLIVVLLLALVLSAAVFGRDHWYYRHFAKPRKVADVAGPAGSDRTYELQYARNGDLVFRPVRGNPIVTFYDYYGDLRVARAEWPADGHVRLNMQDGTVIDIRVRMRINYQVGRP